jgi:hypothetical protein
MKNWYSTVYKAFIIASIISFIIGVFTQSQTSFGAYIAGYSVLTLGVMLILVLVFSNILRVFSNASMLQTLSVILMTAGPFILLLACITFVLYLLIKYKNNIIQGHVSPSYNTFSNIIIMLLLLQIYLVYNNVSTEHFEVTGKMSKVTTSFIYLLGTLTGICAITLYNILKYFSTDGFTSNFH